MLQFNSALLSICGAFTGTYAPFEAIHIEPAGDQGVLVIASDGGKVTAIGYDAQGRGDTELNLLAGQDLLTACRPIKGAARDVAIDGDQAVVTTYRKSKNEVKTFPILCSSRAFPPVRIALAACIKAWGATPTASATAGRYSTQYLEKVIKAAGTLADSIVLSAFDGGPLRLQAESLDLMLLVMPQTAEAIPPVPEWAIRFAHGAC